MEKFKQNLIIEKQEYMSLTLESINVVDKYFAKSKIVKNIMYTNLKNYFDVVNEYEKLIDYYISLKDLSEEDIYDSIGIDIKDTIYDVINYYMDIMLNYNFFFEENDMSYLELETELFNNELINILDNLENSILSKYDVKNFLLEQRIGNKEFFKHINTNKQNGIYSLNVTKDKELLDKIIITTNDNYNLENRLKEIEYYVKAYYMYYFINKEFNFDFKNIDEIIENLKKEYLSKVGYNKQNKILRKKIGDKHGK